MTTTDIRKPKPTQGNAVYTQLLFKSLATVAMLSALVGCTITGEPKPGDVVFDGESYQTTNQTFQNAITVGEVENFPGTSMFTYGGKLAPNFSDETFKEVLALSLQNANFHGDGYTLDAKLIESGDWSDWAFSMGDLSRPISIEYTLYKSGSQSVLFQDVIESEVTITNHNILRPFYQIQKEAAALSYEQNIQKLIEALDDL